MNPQAIVSLSNVRKVGELGNIADLDGFKAEALSYGVAVGLKATSSAMSKNNWTLTALAALECQHEHADIPERLIAWNERKDKIKSELRSAVMLETLKTLNVHRDVKAGRAGEDKATITPLQNLSVKGEKLVDNYYGRIADAWSIGLKIDSTDVKDVGRVPESAGALARRVADKKASSAPATPESHINGLAGRLAGNITGVYSKDASEQDRSAIGDILTACDRLFQLYKLNRISPDDMSAMADEINALADTASDALTEIPEAGDRKEADTESKEAEPISAAA